MTRIRFNRFARSVTTLGLKRIRRKYIDVVHRDENIAEIVLHNAAGNNDVNVQFLEELDHVLGAITERWSLRTVLLRSLVPGTFSKGDVTDDVSYLTHTYLRTGSGGIWIVE